MKIRINTQKIKTSEVDSIGTSLGYILANSALVKVSSNKKGEVLLLVANNPFEKMSEKSSNINPTDKAVNFIKQTLKADGTKNKNVIKVFTLGISDAANARKIKGKLFYMDEVRRITKALVRAMDNNYVDDSRIIILK